MSDTLPVAAVIGGGHGIGRAVALHLGSTHHVHIADLDLAAAQVSADRIVAGGGSASAASLDLGDASSIDAWFDQLDELEGTVKALVITAALFPRLQLDETTADEIHHVFGVNVIGPMNVILRARRSMRAGSTLVCLTSRAGQQEFSRTEFQRPFALYGASKAALDKWVAGISPDLAEAGLSIHLVTPGGIVRTPGIAALELSDADMARSIGVDEVAGPIAALARSHRLDLSGTRLDATEHGSTWTT